ncbi:MAG: hypothetical protein SGJ10_02605 [Bacteroidota bacterium]|nr:hypothetical protein [Bacteroidota bacterium]
MKFRTKIILIVVGLLTIGLVWVEIDLRQFADGINADPMRRDSLANATFFSDTSQTKIIAADNDMTFLVLTKQILTILKSKNYKMLSYFIHPTIGLRFSPYAHIDTTSDITFTTNNFLDKTIQQNKFNWGSYDGSGDKILLTIENYFKQFVYSADFLNADKTSLNKIIGVGNSSNNLETIYKNCNFTESYFAGFDKKLDGMDWCCLRLVYKKYNSKNYLIGIVHDQWTI